MTPIPWRRRGLRCHCGQSNDFSECVVRQTGGECPRPGTFHGMFWAWKVPQSVPGLEDSMGCSRSGRFHRMFQAWNTPWEVPGLEDSTECSRPGTLHGMFQACNIPWNVSGLEHSTESSRLGTFHGSRRKSGSQTFWKERCSTKMH